MCVLCATCDILYSLIVYSFFQNSSDCCHLGKSARLSVPGLVLLELPKLSVSVPELMEERREEQREEIEPKMCFI